MVINAQRVLIKITKKKELLTDGIINYLLS